ncbi:hypothetical protein [Haladaptatus halobius]|uniref:hypothetical protein n=1 Tax=Haladaptatus halobius TaxID=2884875 RepID=UPI001D0B8F98|nr:hypothetical protein [Haladaptatus halobius]
MKHRNEGTGERPPEDVSHSETLKRWRLLGAVLKLWGDAIKVWLKIVAALLAGLAAISKVVPPFN